MNQDRIILEGMEFYAYHGAMPEENRLGQRFVVDLILTLDLEQAGTSDALEDTVNYAAVYDRVKTIIEGEPVKLLETLARRIVGMVIEEFELVCSAEVCLHKPGAPIHGVFKDVSITMCRDRS